MLAVSIDDEIYFYPFINGHDPDCLLFGNEV
jgi:hypothetical protein